MKQIVLASASPRRREILSSLGVRFSVVVSDADESSDLSDPVAFAEELAKKKGLAVFETLKKNGQSENVAVLAADTVVWCDGEILGKPESREDARRMLTLLRGRTHRVVTGVAVVTEDGVFSDHSDTAVRVADIPDDAIERYIDSGEPMDKAGAYGIQGSFSRWIFGIDGCYFGVVGLPIHTLAELYRTAVGEELC